MTHASSTDGRLAPADSAEDRLRRSEARYRSLVEATSTAVWAADASFAVTEDSPSWRALTGQDADELLGLGWLQAVHPDERETAQLRLRAHAAHARPFSVEQRIRRVDGDYGSFLVRCVPVVITDGPQLIAQPSTQPISEWVCTFLDVSAVRAAVRQREVARVESTAVVERLQRLQWTTAALSEATTVDDVAAVVLRSARRLPGVVRGGLALASRVRRELRFVALHDEGAAGGSRPWCTIDSDADLPISEVVRTAAPLFFPAMDSFRQRFPHLVERQRELGATAFAAIPLVVGEETIGGLMLQYDSEQVFPEPEKAFLSALAAQAAQALRRAFDYEQQRGVAEILQRSLLPESLPELPGLAVGATYQPAGEGVDVGGDWFDVVPLDDGSVVVALGDVMGKGLPAATVMGQVRAALRSYALLDPEPQVVLARLDRMVATLGVPEQIVTLAYVLVSPDRSQLSLGLAGHVPPALVTRDGEPWFLDLDARPPLGVGVPADKPIRIPFEPGSVLVLCSDGLVDTRTRSITEGLERLRLALRNLDAAQREPRELCAKLINELTEPGDDDDVAVLALASLAGRHLRTATLALPADHTAPRQARRFLLGRLAEWQAEPDLCDVAELCVSELVTNAVVHSGTAPWLAVHLDEQRLLVVVNDAGRRGTVRLQNAAPDDDSGRGLVLVDALATAWAAERGADGTTVWCELQRNAGSDR